MKKIILTFLAIFLQVSIFNALSVNKNDNNNDNKKNDRKCLELPTEVWGIIISKSIEEIKLSKTLPELKNATLGFLHLSRTNKVNFELANQLWTKLILNKEIISLQDFYLKRKNKIIRDIKLQLDEDFFKGRKQADIQYFNWFDDINAKDKRNWTALMFAVVRGSKEIIELLIKNGININVKNNIGQTALMLAVKHGHQEIAELLIQYGADVNIQDENGWTALVEALTVGLKGDKGIAELLIKNGADINVQNNKGFTPLMIAIVLKYQEMAELLIKYGADIYNIKDKQQKTAFAYALEYGINLSMKN